MKSQVFGRLAVGLLMLFCIAVVGCSGCRRGESPSADSSAKEAETIVICSWGGGYQESQEEAFFQPFEKDTGISIVRARPWSGEYTLLQSSDIPWDLVLISESALFRGEKEGLLRRIPAEVTAADGVIRDLVHPYGVPADTFSTGIAWKTVTGANPPMNWEQFWDINHFPGPRSLRDKPSYALEFALLADGVAADKLYPLDLDRAFRKLDLIKPSIRKWWHSGADPVELLNSGEVTYSSAWSGRIFNARTRSIPLAMALQQAIIEPEYWAIPARRNVSEQKLEQIYRFLKFYLRPDRQAKMTELFGVSPVNQKAIELLPEAVRNQLVTSPDNLRLQVRANSRWWAENEEAVEERFQEWLLK